MFYQHVVLQFELFAIVHRICLPHWKAAINQCKSVRQLLISLQAFPCTCISLHLFTCNYLFPCNCVWISCFINLILLGLSLKLIYCCQTILPCQLIVVHSQNIFSVSVSDLASFFVFLHLELVIYSDLKIYFLPWVPALKRSCYTFNTSCTFWHVLCY